MLSQPKVDLAVLLRLFQHSESRGQAETPNEILHQFGGRLSLRRIELALEELERRGEVTREYHPFHVEEGVWQITRDGMKTVEKALRLPMSFIARLNSQGIDWLESDEAQATELATLPRYHQDGQGSPASVPSNRAKPNAVEKARHDLLIAMVIEASKNTSHVPDLEDLIRRYHVKVAPAVAKSAIVAWEDRGLLVVSRLLNGDLLAAVKQSRFADALEIVLEYLDASLFEVDWRKEEILTDAEASIDIPCQNGWKLLHCEREDRPAAPEAKAQAIPQITIQNTFAPVNTNSVQAPQSKDGISWSGWVGALVALIIGAGGIVATLMAAGKL